jgi:threonine synthase
MFATGIRCLKCGAEYPLQMMYNCPECRGILDVQYNYAAIKKEGKSPANLSMGKDKGMWRFQGLLPVQKKDCIVSLIEGDTPLLRCRGWAEEVNELGIHLKDETRNPTGSFKDRPISCAISKAKEEGRNVVITSSSGNAGVAVASYAANAGMRAIIIVPSTTPRNKVLSIVCFGALLVKVRGTTSDCFNIARELSQKHDWANLASTFLNPFCTEGDKTVAYELYEQLRSVPDWIVVPVGVGPLLVGIYKGYKELKELGIIQKLPAMIAVQAKGCAPIAKAFGKGESQVKPWTTPRTIASGIADPLRGYSGDGTLTLQIIRESEGVAVTVEDTSMMDSVIRLSNLTGVFAEPTGASSVASLRKLKTKGLVKNGETVVCMITGSGFKDTSTIEKYVQVEGKEVAPSLAEVEREMERRLA